MKKGRREGGTEGLHRLGRVMVASCLCPLKVNTFTFPYKLQYKNVCSIGNGLKRKDKGHTQIHSLSH